MRNCIRDRNAVYLVAVVIIDSKTVVSKLDGTETGENSFEE